MKKIVLSLFLLLSIITSVAAEQNRRASFYGLGNESCGKFLAALQKTPVDEALDYNGKSYASETRLYTEWFLAYITAYNIFNEQMNNINHADRTSITFWVKSYCEKHSMNRLSQAAWALVIEQGNLDVRAYK